MFIFLYQIPEPDSSDGDGIKLDTTAKVAQEVAITENGLAERRVAHPGATALPTTPEEDEEEDVIFVMPVPPTTPTTPTPMTPGPTPRTDDEVVLFSREPELPGKPDRRSSKVLLTRADSLMSLASSCAMAPLKQKVYADDEPGNSCWDDCILVKVLS